MSSHIEQHFFGPEDTPLFGRFHIPTDGQRSTCGIVFCYPFGHEYFPAYRAFAELAHNCSVAGFHALCFDYFGCGDSAGAAEEALIGRWCCDISSAVLAMKQRCGVERVCVVGLRLGATLAMIANSLVNDADCLVLWDPIVNGRTYIAELTQMHKMLLSLSNAKTRRMTQRESTEVIGFPLTEHMQADLNNLDLLEVRARSGENVLLIGSDEQLLEGTLGRHLIDLGVSLQVRCVHGSPVWLQAPHQVLLPQDIQAELLSWLSKECM